MSVALRAVIVDDEPLARARLGRLLAQEDRVEVVGVFADGQSAVDALGTLAADVVFLDVRMPQVDGFAVLERIVAPRPQIVFVTAHAEHALHAFDAHAIDYLLKPVAPDRLRESVARVRSQFAARIAASTVEAGYPERLAVLDGARLRMVRVRDVECVLAQGNYVELRVGGRGLLLRETMAGIEARLDPRLFLRIHRSRIVRIDLVDQVEPHGAGQYLLRLRSGLRIASGRQYRQALRHALGVVARA
ncbi:LytTR family two component transcriptional regulator [Luteimonas cucumeris]|uniref:LytTR family two component transcriptional regulator n=1 Tax=Luteimonas cucumeris TaxID=985012 RepID=A0A562LBH8_9GAMM|nr:LytTR family DNA-binding domain-containing protein [Luteimonas cucumeris]TWI04980.1 LytTR family two component transcriptional regulator [Luteimonas cucumeris]